ncbi:unnamed protein product [Arctia plantaginis]|uniref:FLYWCH-type domain-containing protein n=1 Tax=Arctia plantaginis TaxID=874455 RepID=A0A8S1AZA0_ARCPL|nr:unnamed protein product [Arctia plantaginis]
MFTKMGIMFAQSSRGARIVIMNGYKYRKQRENGSKVRWFCSQQGYGCRSVIYTTDNILINMKYEHNHDPPDVIM